jgi:hypothetical protein
MPTDADERARSQKCQLLTLEASADMCSRQIRHGKGDAVSAQILVTDLPI